RRLRPSSTSSSATRTRGRVTARPPDGRHLQAVLTAAPRGHTLPRAHYLSPPGWGGIGGGGYERPTVRFPSPPMRTRATRGPWPPLPLGAAQQPPWLGRRPGRYPAPRAPAPSPTAPAPRLRRRPPPGGRPSAVCRSSCPVHHRLRRRT